MPAAEVVDLADELFAAIERGDEARLDDLFADDIAVWRAGARRDDDKVAGAEGAALVHRRHHASAATRSSIASCSRAASSSSTSCTPTGRNGGSIALRVCIVIKLGVSPSSQALISRIDEYFDPADIAPLMG